MGNEAILVSYNDLFRVNHCFGNDFLCKIPCFYSFHSMAKEENLYRKNFRRDREKFSSVLILDLGDINYHFTTPSIARALNFFWQYAKSPCIPLY